MVLRLKRYLVTGFLILAPISITIFLLYTFVSLVDRGLSPIVQALLGRYIPGLGLIVAALLMIVAGFLGSNIIGQHLLDALEEMLLRIPVFNWLYRTVKQLTELFSPAQKPKFQSVVMIEYPRPGVYSLGFVTKELEDSRDGKAKKLRCVYVPTNHLYIGDLVLVPAEKVLPTRLTLQEGVQTYLSAGATLPPDVAPET